MTELKHGSNVAGLQTEATLDVRTDEWVVNVSPAARAALLRGRRCMPQRKLLSAGAGGA